MADLIFGFLVDVAFQFLVEFIFEAATEAIIELFNPSRKHGTVLSTIGLVLGGAVAGVISSTLIAHRLAPNLVGVPGLSLFVAPLIAGAAMKQLGNLARRIGLNPSILLTFRGGAIFAFSMALIRFWLVGLSH